MKKKYYEFMNELSSDELYEGLLGYGLFNDKLPPVLTSKVFLIIAKWQIRYLAIPKRQATVTCRLKSSIISMIFPPLKRPIIE